MRRGRVRTGIIDSEEHLDIKGVKWPLITPTKLRLRHEQSRALSHQSASAQIGVKFWAVSRDGDLSPTLPDKASRSSYIATGSTYLLISTES
jgi:hypothetical protein